MAGFSQASNAIKTVEDPGMDAATRVLVKANIMRQVLDKQSVDLGVITNNRVVNSAGLLVAGTPLASAQRPAAMAALLEAMTAVPLEIKDGQSKLDANAGKLEETDALKKAFASVNASMLAGLAKCEAQAADADKAVVTAMASTTSQNDRVATTTLSLAQAESDVVTGRIHTMTAVFDSDVDAVATAINAEIKNLAPDKKVTKAVTDSLAATLSTKTYVSYCK